MKNKIGFVVAIDLVAFVLVLVDSLSLQHLGLAHARTHARGMTATRPGYTSSSTTTLLLLLLLLCFGNVRLGFALMSVRPIGSAADVRALADLRFDEWIAGKYNDTSRAAFGAATAELYAERAAAGAVAFLASLDDNQQGVVVGAGEISPIELEGAMIPQQQQLADNQDDTTINMKALYVTDVVTARQHRRKGVAKALLQAMQDYAQTEAAQCLLLHVEHSNTAAMAFYKAAGYTTSMPEYLQVDTDRLADNAGTVGQVLLCKPLLLLLQSQKGALPKKQKVKKTRRQGGGGFG